MDRYSIKDIRSIETCRSSQIGGILSRTKKLIADLASDSQPKGIGELRKNIDLLEKAILEEQSGLMKYKLIFDNINTGIGFSDTETKKIIELNPKFCEIFEVEQSDCINTDYAAFFDEFIMDTKVFERGKEIFRKSGEIYGFELPIKTRNGSMKYILAFSVGIPEIGQEFFTVIDITKQKSIEKLREDTENILNHDLKGPIISIGGNSARLIRKFGFDEEPRKMIETILAEAQKMEDMINSHFELMQMEQGKYQMRYGRIEIVSLIRKIGEGFDDLKKSYGTDIMITLPEEDPSCDYDIIGDRKWISCLFSNLIKNAIEHSSRGSSVKIMIKKADEMTIRVDITNDQPVPHEIRDRIMVDKYVTCGKAGGTGLGIYSAKLIAESHRGKIDVRTCDMEGTCVGVSLKISADIG